MTGPRDVIGTAPVGVLSEDLRAACFGALQIRREACTAFAAEHTWEACARTFVDHMADINGTARKPAVIGLAPEQPRYVA